MRGMFAGVVPAEKQGPLCDACVGIFEQVNELLDDPAFQDQAVEFARNFCGLADSVPEDAVLSAECAYMVDVYGVDFRRGKTARRGLHLPRSVPLDRV